MTLQFLGSLAKYILLRPYWIELTGDAWIRSLSFQHDDLIFINDLDQRRTHGAILNIPIELKNRDFLPLRACLPYRPRSIGGIRGGEGFLDLYGSVLHFDHVSLYSARQAGLNDQAWSKYQS